MKILVLNGSSREQGNTEWLTHTVLRDLPHTVIHLREKHIQQINDKRHTAEGFQPVDDDFDEVITQVLHHDLLIFATPLYWYGMSGIMKNFVDRWSQALRDSRYQFKTDMARKEAYLVIVGGDNPRIKALPLVQQFQYIFGFVSTPFGGYVIGEGNKPGDVANDERAMLEAEAMYKQLVYKLQG